MVHVVARRGMRRNPTVLAWVVLVVSFFGCVALAFAVPSAVRWYVGTAMIQKPAEVEVIRGTVLLQQSGDRAEVGVMARRPVAEGDAVRTTDDSQAVIWLFDGSNIRLWPGSRLVLQGMKATRFSDALTSISALLNQGHCRVEVALPATESRRLEIVTPTATVQMREGSYTIEVSTTGSQIRTDVVTHNGSASVTAMGKTVEVLRGERTTVAANQPPADPLAAARNLVQNGDFSQGLDTAWVRDSRAEDAVLPEVSLGVEDGRNVARFTRKGSSKHGEAYLIQQINRDVTDFESLALSLELKLSNQSLAGGGWLGSEYPLMVRLRYRDVHGSETFWVRGFYYQNVDNHPTSNGIQVPQNVWYRMPQPFDLFDPATISPRPAYVLTVELVAMGWDFESAATNVQLIGE